MKHKHCRNQEGHPPAALLLLHLEGDLEGRDAETVPAHVGSCEQCRYTCEQFERGMARFTEFRNHVEIPAATSRPAEMQRRLREADREASRGGGLGVLRRLLAGSSNRRLALAMGVAACALIVGFLLFLGNPRQSVYASQILNDARNASNSLMVQSKVLNQKFRLRRANLVLERTAHHGRVSSAQTSEPPVDAQLQRSLDMARVRLEDPLSVNDFSDWRSDQSEHTDRVTETPQSFTITVHVNGSAVTEGSLTLSRSELRPIARRVEFRDEAPIEITEESYSINESSPATSVAGSSASPNALPSAVAPAAETAEPSVLELENAELDLRESFHKIGVDVSAAPIIWRADQTVFYHAEPKNPVQGATIETAVSHIEHVKEAEHAPSQEPGQNLTEPGPYRTTPPLATALKQALGSEQAVAAFLDSLRNRSAKVEGEAGALNELGKRYSPETVRALPPDLRNRVNTLASGLLSSLQHDVADYEKFLTPTLDTVNKGMNTSESVSTSDNLPGCLSWQQSAALAAPQLRQLRQDVLLMFTSQEGESTATPKPEELLADTSRIHSFLEAHLISTCELF
jgi:hypothetical protein